MSDVSKSIYKIEPLNGNNFQSWKYNMKLILMERGLWGFIQGTESSPAADAAADIVNAYKLKSDKAYSLIALSIEKSLQIHIVSTVNPKVAWDKLVKHFEFISITQVVRITRKFYAATMQEGDDLLKHITYMTSLAEQLREMKEEISSKKFAVAVLGSLPESFDTFMTSLNARDAESFEWEEIQGALVEEFLKKNDKKEKHLSDEAFLTRNGYSQRTNNRSNLRRSSYRGNTSNISSYCGNTSNMSSYRGNTSNIKCFSCNGYGHISRVCPSNVDNANKDQSYFVDNNGIKSSGDDVVNNSGLTSTYGGEFGLFSSVINRSSEWFIDSGATRHMAFDKSVITEFQVFDNPMKIYLGDSTVVYAHGEGKVKFPYAFDDSGSHITLYNVLFVPKLTKNLISVSAMALFGAKIYFDEKKMCCSEKW